MDNSIPKAIWDFKNKDTRDQAFQIYSQIISRNSNQQLAIATTIATLKNQNADMTQGYVPEAVPTATPGATPTTQTATPSLLGSSQKPQSLPKKDFVQPYLFNPDDYR